MILDYLSRPNKISLLLRKEGIERDDRGERRRIEFNETKEREREINCQRSQRFRVHCDKPRSATQYRNENLAISTKSRKTRIYSLASRVSNGRRMDMHSCRSRFSLFSARESQATEGTIPLDGGSFRAVPPGVSSCAYYRGALFLELELPTLSSPLD